MAVDKRTLPVKIQTDEQIKADTLERVHQYYQDQINRLIDEQASQQAQITALTARVAALE
jgi:hypothetical protein